MYQKGVNIRTRIKKPQNYLLLDEYGKNENNEQDLLSAVQHTNQDKDYLTKKVKKHTLDTEYTFTKQQQDIYNKVTKYINKKPMFNNQMIIGQVITKKQEKE